ncbi:hypothetical protein Cadr_000011759 [Camelus dromedarius]|uniref:Uncharacterized protein n=1 Tax=Camelus dromedarius TaxID=9838 RepID=A0A5N4DTN3_CAMDR|nr:hypothetical protein Cadr_000011759 [Camelus dromedarius]
MLTVSFLIQGAKILCLGITASGIYLGQVTSMISHSTNPQTPTTVSKPTYPVRAGQGHSDNSPSKIDEVAYSSLNFNVQESKKPTSPLSILNSLRNGLFRSEKEVMQPVLLSKQECPKENTTTHAVGIVYNLESSTGADPP